MPKQSLQTNSEELLNSKTRNRRKISPAKRLPSYRQRAGYSQAIVTLTDAKTRKRRDYWLGEFGSPKSRERYHRVIAEWERLNRRLPAIDFDEPKNSSRDEICVVEVIRDYWQWAQAYYRPKHVQCIDGALTLLREHYGRTPAASFGPKKLRSLRDHMIRGDGQRRKPWARSYINAQVRRIRHVFKWAAAQELVPVSVYEALGTLEALRFGASKARETKKVGPAPIEIVEAVLPNLPKPLQALVRLQLLTGARPGELLQLRMCDLERDESVWTYRPAIHKNAHRGRDRTLYFGPQAQAILLEMGQDRAAEEFLFSPADALAEIRSERTTSRQTPLNEGNQPGNNRVDEPTVAPGATYTTGSYNRAIQYACLRTFAPPAHLAKQDGETTEDWRNRLEQDELWEEYTAWRESHRFHPNQLRHTAATELRKQFGLEAAQLTLGHASAQVTDAVYAERDRAKVMEVMRQVG